MLTATLIDTLEVKNQLGEGVIWDSDSGAAWWTDIDGMTLYRYDWCDRRLAHWATPERLGSFALVASSDDFICAFASGFAYFNPVSAKLRWLQRVTEPGSGLRLNDGRADRQGRFWAGSMVESGEPGGGALYCLDQRLTMSRKLSGLTISNGLCWSPDSTTMYHTDSPTRCIYRYDFDPQNATLDNRKLWVTTEDGCFPDGATVDSQGYVWSAQWGASRIVRYTPDGEVDYILLLPMSQPSCVAFGGPNLDVLFVTSARQGMSSEACAAQPEAGNLLVFQTDVTGIADPSFVPQ